MSDTVTGAPAEATPAESAAPPVRPLIQLLEQPDADGCCGGGSCGI